MKPKTKKLVIIIAFAVVIIFGCSMLFGKKKEELPQEPTNNLSNPKLTAKEKEIQQLTQKYIKQGYSPEKARKLAEEEYERKSKEGLTNDTRETYMNKEWRLSNMISQHCYNIGVVQKKANVDNIHKILSDNLYYDSDFDIDKIKVNKTAEEIHDILKKQKIYAVNTGAYRYISKDTLVNLIDDFNNQETLPEMYIGVGYLDPPAESYKNDIYWLSANYLSPKIKDKLKFTINIRYLIYILQNNIHTLNPRFEYDIEEYKKNTIKDITEDCHFFVTKYTDYYPITSSAKIAKKKKEQENDIYNIIKEYVNDSYFQSLITKYNNNRKAWLEATSFIQNANINSNQPIKAQQIPTTTTNIKLTL